MSLPEVYAIEGPQTYEEWKEDQDVEATLFEWLKVAKYYGVCKDIRKEIYYEIYASMT